MVYYNVMNPYTKGKQNIEITCTGCNQKISTDTWQNIILSLEGTKKTSRGKSFFVFEEDECLLNEMQIVCRGEFFGTIGLVLQEDVEKVRKILSKCKEYRIELAENEEVGQEKMRLIIYWN